MKVEPAGKRNVFDVVGQDDRARFTIVMKAKARLNVWCGAAVLSEHLSDGHVFQTKWLNKQVADCNQVFLIDVGGDSMEPIIADSSTVMIDQGRKDILDGCIYAIGINDMIMIKRLEMRPGGIVRVILIGMEL